MHQFAGRRVEHLCPQCLEERRSALAGEVTEQKGVGRGRRRRCDALANLAAAILKWFLAKFGYPAELMEPLQLKKSKIIGLEGKVLFEESSERQWPQAVGFERLDETELEDRVARMNVPAVDINEDLRKELECLDNL